MWSSSKSSQSFESNSFSDDSGKIEIDEDIPIEEWTECDIIHFNVVMYEIEGVES